MRISRGEIIFYAIIIISVIMVNPPIMWMVNRHAMENPLTFNFPTIWLWLQFWYFVMIASFLISAIYLKRWRCFQDAKEIVPEPKMNLEGGGK
jgi:hypothetical protein